MSNPPGSYQAWSEGRKVATGRTKREAMQIARDNTDRGAVISLRRMWAARFGWATTSGGYA